MIGGPCHRRHPILRGIGYALGVLYLLVFSNIWATGFANRNPPFHGGLERIPRFILQLHHYGLPIGVDCE